MTENHLNPILKIILQEYRLKDLHFCIVLSSRAGPHTTKWTKMGSCYSLDLKCLTKAHMLKGWVPNLWPFWESPLEGVVLEEGSL